MPNERGETLGAFTAGRLRARHKGGDAASWICASLLSQKVPTLTQIISFDFPLFCPIKRLTAVGSQRRGRQSSGEPVCVAVDAPLTPRCAPAPPFGTGASNVPDQSGGSGPLQMQMWQNKLRGRTSSAPLEAWNGRRGRMTRPRLRQGAARRSCATARINGAFSSVIRVRGCSSVISALSLWQESIQPREREREGGGSLSAKL